MKKVTGRLLLAAAAALLLLAEDCPDYKIDSETGGIPNGTPASGASRTFHIDEAPSNPLRCNKAFFTRAVSHETGVNCAGYDFTPIYKEADGAAKKRAESMKCPDMDCSKLVTDRTWHSWNCAGGTADVIVVWYAMCPRTEAPGPLPPSQAKATAAQLQAVNVNATPQPTTKENAETTDSTAKLKCSPASTVVFHYEVVEATRPASLESYVKDAEKFAKEYASTIQCAAGCTKQKFNPIYETWKWKAGVVYVDVYFVPCK